MILDATAGNRTMWNAKNVENIIYLDVEKKLMRKPTIFADNTKCPFKDNVFDTIFYDPPHNWGYKDEPYPIYPSEIKRWKQQHEIFAFTYYGWDKFKSWNQLLAHIYYAQREFYRILKDDGLLWIKWNEMRKPLQKILSVFKEKWVVLLTLRVNDVSHTASNHQTYWVCMKKNLSKYIQTHLEEKHKKKTEIEKETSIINIEFI